MIKKTLNLGIDIDNVIADTYSAYIEEFNKQFGTEIVHEEIVDFFYFEKYSGIKKDKVVAFFERVNETKLSLIAKPYSEAISVISKFNSLGISIHYITARPETIRESTLKWLKKHGFFMETNTLDMYPQSESYYHGDYKQKVIDRFGVDIMIEDSLEIVQSIRVPVLLLDRPWNRKTLSKNIHRVHSWKEIETYVLSKLKST